MSSSVVRKRQLEPTFHPLGTYVMYLTLMSFGTFAFVISLCNLTTVHHFAHPMCQKVGEGKETKSSAF